MKTFRTRAIVLRRTNYGEADRVLQLLTPEGKRSVVAKGVRREKSRLASGIELFAVCDVVISEGRGELGILSSARLVHFYRHIMEDYDRLQFAYEAVKLVSGSSEMVDGSEWYDVLVETLAGLDIKSVNLDLVKTWFYLRYAVLTGYGLGLYTDINGNKIMPDLSYSYDVTERGLKLNENGELKTDHIKLLRLVSTKSLKVLAQIGGIATVIPDCLLTARQHAAVK